ncbi:MAG: sigma-70 family RNA polymerase sigma factor [Lachnospiraceae bacterium]
MEAYVNLSDDELIQRYRAGEAQAGDYLMNKYKEIVRFKARAMYLIGGDTDDLIQEGMVGLFKAIRDFDSGQPASFATFANLCIERQLYTAIESSNRKKHLPLNTYVSLSGEDQEELLSPFLRMDTPESIIIGQESAAGMEQQIKDSLSRFENQVLDIYLKGFDYLQIADQLGKPAKSIDNALQRIRLKVRKSLEEEKQ